MAENENDNAGIIISLIVLLFAIFGFAIYFHTEINNINPLGEYEIVCKEHYKEFVWGYNITCGQAYNIPVDYYTVRINWKEINFQTIDLTEIENKCSINITLSKIMVERNREECKEYGIYKRA